MNYQSTSITRDQQGDAMAGQQIPLAEVLAHIGDELVRADQVAWERGRSAMLFQECEVEFAVKAAKKRGAGLTIYVLDLSGSKSSEVSNKVRLKFTASDIAIAAMARGAAQDGGGPDVIPKKQKPKPSPRKKK